MTKTLLDKLTQLDRIQTKVMDEYTEKLNRVFQIVYEIDAKVQWGSLTKCYPTGNFGFIKGMCFAKQGTSLKNPQGETVELDADLSITVGFILPLKHVDRLTPYELAEFVHQMKMLEVVCTPEEFRDNLMNDAFDIEDIEGLLPTGIVREPQEDDEEKQEPTRPDEIDGFDVSGLSQEQLDSLITNVVGNHGTTKQ